MKTSKIILILSSSVLIQLVAHAQSTSFKCDVDRFKNSHSDNTEFNNLIDNACSEIGLNNYQHASKLLAEALRVDSIASNGIINSYIESQYRKLKRFIEESGSNLPAATAEKSVEVKTESSASNESKTASTKAEESVQREEEKVQAKEQEPRTKAAEPILEEKVETKPEPVTEPLQKQEAVSLPASPEKNEIAVTEKPEPVESKTAEQVSAPSSEEVAPGDAGEKKFSPEMIDDFHNKGMQKVKQLESFVYQIGSKSTPANIAITATENSLKLFDSEERTVQVSSAAKGTKNKYKVKTYLQRLRNLNYSDVTIEWADFQYASDFIKGSDGNYHGYIVFEQRFSATLENMSTYTDITTKKIEVILKLYEKAQQGELTENWDVLLGDVSVVQTENN